MSVKLTYFLRQDSFKGRDSAAQPVRSWGWTESWYRSDSLATTDLIDKARALGELRALLLGSGAYIAKVRIQQVDPLGASRLVKLAIPGKSTLLVDNPKNGLQFNAFAVGNLNKRITILRGTPDTRMVQGEYSPQPAYDRALNNYWAELIQNGWKFRGKGLLGTRYRVASISAGGVVVTKDATAFNLGDEVQVLRSHTAEFRYRGGVYTISAFVDNKHFTLADWPFAACQGGTMRAKPLTELFNVGLTVDDLKNPDVVTRDTGAPIAPSRGRQSAKR